MPEVFREQSDDWGWIQLSEWNQDTFSFIMSTMPFFKYILVATLRWFYGRIFKGVMITDVSTKTI